MGFHGGIVHKPENTGNNTVNKAETMTDSLSIDLGTKNGIPLPLK